MDVAKLLFSSTDTFKVLAVDRHADRAQIYVQSKQQACVCPNCKHISRRLHSYYTRRFRDLPVFGNESVVFLKTRKFYCRAARCPIKVFSERFWGSFFEVSAKHRSLSKDVPGYCLGSRWEASWTNSGDCQSTNQWHQFVKTHTPSTGSGGYRSLCPGSWWLGL